MKDEKMLKMLLDVRENGVDYAKINKTIEELKSDIQVEGAKVKLGNTYANKLKLIQKYIKSIDECRQVLKKLYCIDGYNYVSDGYSAFKLNTNYEELSTTDVDAMPTVILDIFKDNSNNDDEWVEIDIKAMLSNIKIAKLEDKQLHKIMLIEKLNNGDEYWVYGKRLETIIKLLANKDGTIYHNIPKGTTRPIIFKNECNDFAMLLPIRAPKQ